MGKGRSDCDQSESPAKMNMDFGFISPLEEAAALEASRKSGASLHILRFADGVTAIVTEPRIGTESASRFSMPSIAKPMLQAYAEVQTGLQRHMEALRREKLRRKKKAGKERGARG